MGRYYVEYLSDLVESPKQQYLWSLIYLTGRFSKNRDLTTRKFLFGKCKPGEEVFFAFSDTLRTPLLHILL